jgi:RNA polymerase sigma-70 factor (ECF subfamily)
MRGRSRATATWHGAGLGRALVKEQFWRPGTNFRAWLFTIMHNQNVNNVRRDIRDSLGLVIEHVSATLTAATDPTATRKMFELERPLAQLPLQQQVILLVGLEGMSYEDAPWMISTSPSGPPPKDGASVP